MNSAPSDNNPSTPARVSSSLQVGAEKILQLIAAEREDATCSAREHIANLEFQFHSLKNSADASIAAEQTKARAIHESLIRTQALLAQYQQYVANTHNVAQQQHPVPQQHMQITAAPHAQAQSTISDACVCRRCEDLQHTLQDVGIVVREDNSLRFEGGWASVLAQLEARDRCGVMKAGQLQQVLLQLTQRLQTDREMISQLEQRVLSSDEEKQQMTEKYEMEIHALKLELSLLQDGVASRSPVAPSPAASHLSQTSPVSGAVYNVPDAPQIQARPQFPQGGPGYPLYY